MMIFCSRRVLIIQMTCHKELCLGRLRGVIECRITVCQIYCIVYKVIFWYILFVLPWSSGVQYSIWPLTFLSPKKKDLLPPTKASSTNIASSWISESLTVAFHDFHVSGFVCIDRFRICIYRKIQVLEYSDRIGEFHPFISKNRPNTGSEHRNLKDWYVCTWYYWLVFDLHLFKSYWSIHFSKFRIFLFMS